MTRLLDPIPRLGLVERTAARCYARGGDWPAWYLRCLQGAYGHQSVPAHVTQLGEATRRERVRDAADIQALDREGERLGMQLWPPREWFEG